MSQTEHTFRDFVFPWTRGRTLPLDLSVTKTIEGVTTAEDLSDGEIWVTGKTSLADADTDALFRLNLSNGGVAVLDAAAGTARATVIPSRTQNLPDKATPVYLDCVRVTSDGAAYSFQKGTVTFHPSGEETLAMS